MAFPVPKAFLELTALPVKSDPKVPLDLKDPLEKLDLKVTLVFKVLLDPKDLSELKDPEGVWVKRATLVNLAQTDHLDHQEPLDKLDHLDLVDPQAKMDLPEAMVQLDPSEPLVSKVFPVLLDLEVLLAPRVNLAQEDKLHNLIFPHLAEICNQDSLTLQSLRMLLVVLLIIK